ncbi:MAG: hypothetical protein FJZ00_02215 [Candidatus Sericytochromatia bacterium]|uniref:Uncharacterized protein n=1 Tax=Candidatus Tanganyikabacteria bacterium TaxID=2961651 RepID=A0A937X408_9BACT|nr:hypothetical protein [Candidatus Tanganyikabacteria bacterium]
MKPSGGTIIRASRALKGPERNYLLRRWGAYRTGQAAIAAALLAFLGWAVYSEDAGLRFLFALLAGPALLGIKYLHDKAAIFGLDLRDNSVQSVIGAVGGLDLSPGLVPLHLGERIYYVQADLLRRKREGEPIMVEFLVHTGLAVAIDGRSNLLSLKQWLEVADQAART